MNIALQTYGGSYVLINKTDTQPSWRG